MFQNKNAMMNISSKKFFNQEIQAGQLVYK